MMPKASGAPCRTPARSVDQNGVPSRRAGRDMDRGGARYPDRRAAHDRTGGPSTRLSQYQGNDPPHRGGLGRAAGRPGHAAGLIIATGAATRLYQGAGAPCRVGGGFASWTIRRRTRLQWEGQLWHSWDLRRRTAILAEPDVPQGWPISLPDPTSSDVRDPRFR